MPYEAVCAETCQIDGYRTEHGPIAVALQMSYNAVCAETCRFDGCRIEHCPIAVALQMPYIAACAETCFSKVNKAATVAVSAVGATRTNRSCEQQLKRRNRATTNSSRVCCTSDSKSEIPRVALQTMRLQTAR